jgi:hypothetical protein
MQVGSKVLSSPTSRRPRLAPLKYEPRTRSSHNRKERTMTGVIFLLAVSALLGGSMVLSRDA